jgi:hypothetical protein
VRSISADEEPGDYSRQTAWLDPEIEFGLADGPSPGTRKGPDGLSEAWREFLSDWDEFHVLMTRYLP